MPAAILFFFLLLGLKPVQQPRPLDQLVLRTLTGEPTRLGDFHSPARVIVFLSPECPLCQQYSRKLTQLAQRKDLSVIGVFPGRAYDRADYEQFKRKYSIDFTLLTDANRSLVRALGATTTPEAFLIDGQGQILYRGAIDDWVTALGKTRPQARHHYLASAIDAFFVHQPILPAQVSPIGCLINDL